MTAQQARKLAQQIFDRFDKQIFEAVQGTHIQPAFIAGLVGNEAGKDRQGRIVPEATRFEKHVYNALISIRNLGYRISNGRTLRHYNRIVQADIRDASDAAIRALATSYGATQIMGWHVIHSLHTTIADLRNPDKHFFYTVKLLQLNGYVKQISEEQMDREMRQWNTGSETGRTYHANYVPNARLVRAAYRQIETARQHRPVEARINLPADELEARPEITFEDHGEAPFPGAEEPRRDLQIELLPEEPATTNVSDAPHPQAEAPPRSETVEVDAPPPTGFMAKIKTHLAAIAAFIGGGAGLKELSGFNFSEQTLTLLKYTVPTVLVLGFLGLLVWYVSEKVIGWKTLRLQAEIDSDPGRPNIRIRPQ